MFSFLDARLRPYFKRDQHLALDARLRNKRAYLAERLRGAPLPPTQVMKLVTGNDDAAWYVDSGQRGFQSVADTLQKSHIDIRAMRRTLDLGCGPGRVLRHWKPLARQVELYGCDYNQELVDWGRELVPFARIDRNGLEPPLPYRDGYFDFVYALSVFTHWSHDLQLRWMRELTRVLRPGGLLMFTTMGDYYLFALTPEQREEFARGKLVVVHPDAEGTNVCGSFCSPAFVANELAQGMSVLHYYSRGALGNPWQDVYLLQKPS
jgi:SAM-dependent methyltransferase